MLVYLLLLLVPVSFAAGAKYGPRVLAKASRVVVAGANSLRKELQELEKHFSA